MAGEEPPFLSVGTDVSAKYKGAFCEAKIKKVTRSVKCKVTFKNNQGNALLTDDQVRGNLRVGAHVEAKHPEKNQYLDAIINKLHDYSQYTVVFDDGDETTLRRTSLCLKSGRHFAESETLDQLPLTHPEHFGTPVMGCKGRKRRSRHRSPTLGEMSSDEEPPPKKKEYVPKEPDPQMGKVVCVELGDKKKQKDNWFPALIVSTSAQDHMKVKKDEYMVRSFKDGKYFVVFKKDVRDFTHEIGNKVDNNTLKTAVERAMQYIEKDDLPPHWDRDLLFGAGGSSVEENTEQDSDSDSSDDEPSEEKDRFVAQLYKFMDDRGTPINKAPTVCSRDLNLYRLFKIVQKMGGYNRVTNQSQWKAVYGKMGLPLSNATSSQQMKQAYKRYLHSFDDFQRILGCTMSTTTRSGRMRHRSGRNIIMTRDRNRELKAAGRKSSQVDVVKVKKEKEEVEKKSLKEESVEASPKLKDKPQEIIPADDEQDKLTVSVEGNTIEDLAPNEEMPDKLEKLPETKVTPQSVTEPEASTSSSEKDNETELEDEDKDTDRIQLRKAVNRDRRDKMDDEDFKGGDDEDTKSEDSPKRRGRKKMIKPDDKKRDESDDKSQGSDDESDFEHTVIDMDIAINHRVKVKYGRGKQQKIYEAKVLKIDEDDGGRLYFVHYTGWNMRYDEWVKRHRIVANLTQKLSEKKGRAAAAAAAAKSGKPPAKRGRPVGSTSAKTLAGLTKSPGSLAKSRITRSDKSSPLVNGLELRKRSRKASLIADTSNDQHRGEDSDDCGDDDDSEKREMASESQDALESETDTQVSKESKDKEDFEEKTSEDVTGKDEEDQERPAKIRKARKVKAKLEASDDDDDEDEVLPSTSGIDSKLEKKNARRGRVGRPRTVNRDSDTRDEDADVDEESEEVVTKPKKKGRKAKVTPEIESQCDPICQDTSEQGDTEDNLNESKEETEVEDVSCDPSLEIKDNSTMDTNNDCDDESQQASNDTKLLLEADTAKLTEDDHEEPVRDTFPVETKSECDVEESKEILEVANETTTQTEEESLECVVQLPGDLEKAVEDDETVARQDDCEMCSDAAEVQEELAVVKDEVDIPDKDSCEPLEVVPLVEEVFESVSKIKKEEMEQIVVPKPEDFVVTVPCEQEFTEDLCHKPSDHVEVKSEITTIAEDVVPLVTPKPEDYPTTSDITPVECIVSSQTEPSKDSDPDVSQSLEGDCVINTETDDMTAVIAVEPSLDAEKLAADADSDDVQLLEKQPSSVSKKEKKLKQKSKKSEKKRDFDPVLHQSPSEAEAEDEGCASTEDDVKVVKKKHKEGKTGGKSEEKSSSPGMKILSKKLKARKSGSSSSGSKSRKDGDESRKDESKQKEKKKKREGDKVRKEKPDSKPDVSSKPQSEDKDIAEDDASSDGASGQKKEKKKKQKGMRDDDGEPKKKSKKKSIKPEVSVDDPKQTPADERMADEDAISATAHNVAPVLVPSKDKDAKKTKKGERSEKSKRRKEKSTPSRKETASAEEEESDEKPAVTPADMPSCHNIDISETSESPKETNMESDLSSYLLCKEEVPASPPPPDVSPPPTNATMGSLTLMSLSVCVSTATTVANASANATCAATNNQVFQSPSKHESEPIGVLDNTPPTTPDSSLPTSTSDQSSCSPLTSPARIASSDTPGEQEQEGERDERLQTAAIPSFSDDGVARTMLKRSVDSSGNSSSGHSCSPDPISDLRQLSEAAETKRSLVDTAVDAIPLKKRRKNHRRHHHSVSSSVDAPSPAPVRQRHGSSRSPRSAVSDEESQENVISPCLPLQSTSGEHETAPSVQPRSPRPSRFNFYVELDDYSDGAERIAVIQDRLKELRKTYMALKAEVACLDRRRKKLKRKEKESSCLPSSSATEVECS